MKFKFAWLLLVVAVVFVPGCSKGVTAARPTTLPAPLSHYTNFKTCYVTVLEASAVTYNRDRNSLFIVSDEGDEISEYRLDLIRPYAVNPSISVTKLTGFRDTEGLAYIGGGRFFISEERMQTIYRFNEPRKELVRDALSEFRFAPDAGNKGLEGISYDKLTHCVWGVKEMAPQALYVMDLRNGNKVTINPFNVEAWGLENLADIYCLSNSGAYHGTAREKNLLILSQESRRLLEVDRQGKIVDTLDLAFVNPTGPGQSIEGVTMDDNGVLYLVAERSVEGANGGGTRTSTLYILTPGQPQKSAQPQGENP